MSVEERVRAWVDGELDAAAEQSLFADAERDPALARELSAARGLASMLSRVDVPEPPLHLIQRSMRRAIEEREREAHAPLWRRIAHAVVHGKIVRLRVSAPLVSVAVAGMALLALWARTGQRSPAMPLEVAISRGGEIVERREVAVRLVLQADGARSVAVAGDFNDWSTDSDVLEDPEGDGIFVGTVTLPPGSYSYMFVVDREQWISDPYAANHRDDGFGNRNAVLRID